MDKQRIAENLQLHEGRQEHMQLEQTGTHTAYQWQLQNEAPADWQSVEYVRPTPNSSPAWILPSLVGIALVAVVSYMIYTGFTRFGLNAPDGLASLFGTESTSPDTTAPNNQDDGAADDQPTEGNEEESSAGTEQNPTNTPIPTPIPTITPTDTPPPSPTTSLVEQRIATITNQFGVNARLQPSTAAEVLRILEQNETTIVLGEQIDASVPGGSWLQVQTTEGQVVWIASQFADISTQLVAATPGTVGTIDSISDEAPPIQANVTISSPAGLNARENPSANSEIIAILPNNQTFTAVGRSADSQWIQIQLNDGTLAWIFLQLVIAEVDLNTLPAISSGPVVGVPAAATPTETVEVAVTTTETLTDTEAVTTTDSITGTEPVTTTESLTSTTPADLVGVADESEPNIVVSSLVGVNARSSASTESAVLQVLQNGTSLPAIGRTVDGTWLQITLENGQLAWVFTTAVLTTPDVDSLPIVIPPPVDEPPQTIEAEPIDGSTEITNTTGITETSALTTTTAISPTETLTATTGITNTQTISPTDSGAGDTGITPAVTIQSFIGTNVRAEPNTAQAPVTSLPSGSIVPARGRSADGQWIQIELDGGSLGWVFTNNVTLNVPLESLPITE